MQKRYYNQPTYEKSRATVVDEITKNLVVPIIGETNLAAFRAGFNDSHSDQATRISFKVRINYDYHRCVSLCKANMWLVID